MCRGDRVGSRPQTSRPRHQTHYHATSQERKREGQSRNQIITHAYLSAHIDLVLHGAGNTPQNLASLKVEIALVGALVSEDCLIECVILFNFLARRSQFAILLCFEQPIQLCLQEVRPTNEVTVCLIYRSTRNDLAGVAQHTCEPSQPWQHHAQPSSP